MQQRPTTSARAQLRAARLKGWLFAAFAAYAAFLLVTEHRAHAFDFLLYAFTSLCVLLLVLNAMHACAEEPDASADDQKESR